MTLRYITLALASALALSASAQSLTKEITVEHEIIPEQREATRLNFMPSINLSPITATRLSYSERVASSRIASALTILEPAAFDDAIYVSPFKGYAALGFFPMYNTNLSAGYRFIDNERTRVNGWMQYNGTAYKRDGSYYRRNTASLGAMLHQAIGGKSVLDAGVGYTFARYNLYDADALRPQNLHKFDLNALFRSSHSDFDYNIGVSFNRFAYVDNPDWALAQPAPFAKRQNLYGVAGGMAFGINDRSSLTIDVDFTASSLRMDYLKEYGSKSDQLLTVTPKYSLSGNNAVLDLGARIDFTFHGDKVFHIAPDAKLTIMPASQFSLYVKAGGGEHRNTLSSLYDCVPFVQPYAQNRFSHIPLTADAGITIGPFRGFHFDLYGGYAIANDWLMPAFMDDSRICLFEQIDMKGWRVGAALGYKYNDIVELKASFEAAPQKYDRGYYLWRDRAKNVLDASLRVTPISALDITAGFELRTKRAMWSVYPDVDLSDPGNINWDEYQPTEVSLGNMSNLKLGALYRIDSQWSAFVRGENLLNKKCLLPGNIPMQGLTGLVGVTYKF